MTIRVRDLEDSPERAGEEAPGPSAEQLEEVVHQINGICRSSSVEFALRVGAVVIHHFYNGDTRAWRDRGPKATSFRRLSEHPELALSAGALYRCVAVFEMCDRLRAASRWRRLGASHLRTVIGIPEEKQEYLLNKANTERWTVQRLQEQAQVLRVKRSRGGRRPRSVLGKHLRVLGRCLQDCESAIDSVDSHELGELEQSLEMLEKMKASVDELADALESHKSRLLGDGGLVSVPSVAKAGRWRIPSERAGISSVPRDKPGAIG